MMGLRKLLNLIILLTAMFLGVFLLFGGVVADELININTAGLEELDSLPGIGEVKAQAIIDYRNENGPFGTIEEIMNVSGIGQVTFDNIKGLITVDGDGQGQVEENIVINELLPNPLGSDDFEWIELKNIGQSDINLIDWKIADLSRDYVINTDDFDSTLILAGGFFVLEKEITGIALNNSGGETVRFYNSEGGLVSETSYSESAEDETAWARDGGGNYSWTISLTKASENIMSSPAGEQPASSGGGSQAAPSQTQEAEQIESKYSGYKDIVLINEFLPNPLGIDNEEWVEFYNTSTRAVSLGGWKLKDNRAEYEFKNIKIEAKDFLLLNREETGLVMNNIGGDFLELVDRYGKQVDRVSYKKNVVEGESYNWCDNLNKWIWLTEITPAEANKCPPKNKEPIAYFEIEGGELIVDDYIWLDASESYDRDEHGEIIKYVWEFNKDVFVLGEIGKIFEFVVPRVEIKFLDSGKHGINLKVIDNLEGEDEYEQQVDISRQVGEVDIENIYINKFLPNPAGVDSQEEWIEICSVSQEDIDLTGFKLDDEEGGSRPYVLDDYTLEAGGCILIMSMESRIALNNDSDNVRLFDPQGNLIEQVAYNDASQGLAYSRLDNGNWSWLGSPAGDYEVDELAFYLNSLSEIREVRQGNSVIVRGWVATEPGLMGKTIFYIIDENSGVQIYCYKKDFPLLVQGDLVEVSGVLSDYQGEARIKIQGKSDIINLGPGELPAARNIQLEDVGEELEGALVKIRGELTEIKSSSWWLDDTTQEVKVYIKQNTQIKKGDIKVGDNLEITGLVSEWQGEYRILPRYPDDIKILGKVEGESINQQSNKSINQKGSQWFRYLLVVALAVVMILSSVIIRMKQKKLK